MRKLLYILMLGGAVFFSSCSDELETNPTNKVSGPVIFDNATSAETALNGIYRTLYVAGWSQNWATENNGITSIILLADLMAEDHLMKEQGQGWFYEDYRLNVRADYIHKSGRSYAVWNFFYTIISNTNYILANETTMGGAPADVKNVIGQAYAVRAFAYFNLVQLFQQTYKGNENKPGIPLYTEPTTSKSEGKPRGTVQEVYTQINSDIDNAIKLLKESGVTQKHPSHIDYYVANGLKARISMVQEKWQDASTAAQEALSKPGLVKVGELTAMKGFNNVKLGNVLWGVEITKDQTSGYASFFSHMDADAVGMYASRARQCISTWLYDQIPATDARKAWWRGKLASGEEQAGSSMTSYCQVKFKFSDPTTRTGDYLLMRAEEMILTQAEAECRLGHYGVARTLLLQLAQKRDTDYAERLEKFSDNASYNSNTIGQLATLMDEILFQRRVELWGEFGRIFDLQRLKLGYNRTYEGSNHTEKVTTKDTNAGSKEFIFPLPQSEIDGNPNISATDQNPL